MSNQQRKVVRILFDEYHSETWTISEDRAREMQPKRSANSCYGKAARVLSSRDFVIERNASALLTADTLERADVLVLLHPCQPRWERTTSLHSPVLTTEELEAIERFVSDGGGLVVVTEYENDKYGNNLNDLLRPFGFSIDNTTVYDPSFCHLQNPTWVFAELSQTADPDGLLYLTSKVCFYRAGSCNVTNDARLVLRASDASEPPRAGLVGVGQHGLGRVVVVADSDLFGDEFINEFNHLQLWLNLLYWVSLPAFASHRASMVRLPRRASDPWPAIREATDELRLLQQPDGSLPGQSTILKQASGLIARIVKKLPGVCDTLPHQEQYLHEVAEDLKKWQSEGFGRPDFSKSLSFFNPQLGREDGLEYFALFPMYTPNASMDIRFEALILRIPWPAWLQDIEARVYPNGKFVPGGLVEYTQGYDSECAVLFPETVAVRGPSNNNFGIIFCDREAERFQRTVQACISLLDMALPAHVRCFVESNGLIQDAFALWDLIHDKSHSMGELPFDPFMIKQRSPYWMYALEELRVDLKSFIDALEMSRNFPFAGYIPFAVLFDRILRFPTSQPRVRDYDGLAGQILFTYLHRAGSIVWRDNRLSFDWESLPLQVADLREEIRQLYRRGIEVSRVQYWIAGHDFIAKYVRPNIASKWIVEKRHFDDETVPRNLVDLVHDDEFPLGNFHVNLRRKLE